MNTIVYVVNAYRWGDREEHSYTVGVFSKKSEALRIAEEESTYRGGKYKCEILEVELNNVDKGYKVLLPLPLPWEV